MPVSYSRDLENLENRLGYSFETREILVEALTHKSFYHENPDTAASYNERLEFLGDSVLSLVIVEHLFAYERQFTESMMAKMKSYLVRDAFLSEIASEISLGRYVRLGKGEEDTGGRAKKSILADALEALFGAVYLDGGYENARGLILKLYGARIPVVVASGDYHDYKTELQEESQTSFGVLPEYRVILQEGVEHRKTFTVEVFIAGRKFGKGQGKSKKEAETRAAREAMARLDETV
ncbi:MAG TPA: ribonuclease III [Thermodesulfovibrionales bacterium]|nr:ribonuclease III [Thermodesulfovibrionales bacterium]